jgi:prepilin-type N-terminal cleavage/methylation domain-containing protein
MNKKSFTLMELIVTILILGMLFMFTYRIYDFTVNSQRKITQTLNKDISKNLVINLIYDDIVGATDIKRTNKFTKKLDKLDMPENRHSMYNRSVSYIQYIVKNDNLYRKESSKIIKDDDINIDFVDTDLLLKDIEVFRIFSTTDKKDRLSKNNKIVFIKTKKDIIYFEVRK